MENIGKTYVAGFLFNSDFSQVVLIQKNKPEWQKGYLNGVGGKIEPGETPLQAMIREFEEETTVKIESWREFSIIEAGNDKIHFFTTTHENIEGCKTNTEETIVITDVSDLFMVKTIPNLRWLIPMCMDKHHIHGILQAK